MNEDPQSPSTLASTVGSVAHALSSGGLLTSGDVATLRRMDPRELNAPGIFKLFGTILADARGEQRETRWGTIVVGLAHLGSLHRPGVPLGRALADSGFSEARFVRLLRADGERLVDELPALARYLSAKNVAADFTDAARLLLSEGRDDEERTRRRIARDFYATLSRSEHNAD